MFLCPSFSPLKFCSVQPALSGRHVNCGLRQSIPSSEGLQEYPLW